MKDMKDWIEKNAPALADDTKAVNTDAAVAGFNTELAKLTADDVGTTVIDVSVLTGAKDKSIVPAEQQLFDLQSLGNTATLQQIVGAIKNDVLKALLGTAITNRNIAIAEAKAAATKKAKEEGDITTTINAITDINALNGIDETKTPDLKKLKDLPGREAFFTTAMETKLNALFNTIKPAVDIAEGNKGPAKAKLDAFEKKIGELHAAELVKKDLLENEINDAKATCEKAPPAPPVTVMTTVNIIKEYITDGGVVVQEELEKSFAVAKAADDTAKNTAATVAFRGAIGDALKGYFDGTVNKGALTTLDEIKAAQDLLNKFNTKVTSFATYADATKLGDSAVVRQTAIQTAAQGLVNTAMEDFKFADTDVIDAKQVKKEAFEKFKVDFGGLKAFCAKDFTVDFKPLDKAFETIAFKPLTDNEVKALFVDLKDINGLEVKRIDATLTALTQETEKTALKGLIGDSLVALLKGNLVSQVADAAAKAAAVKSFEAKYNPVKSYANEASTKEIDALLVELNKVQGTGPDTGKPPVTKKTLEGLQALLGDPKDEKNTKYKLTTDFIKTWAKHVAELYKVTKGTDGKPKFALKQVDGKPVELMTILADKIKDVKIEGVTDIADKKEFEALKTCLQDIVLPALQKDDLSLGNEYEAMFKKHLEAGPTMGKYATAIAPAGLCVVTLGTAALAFGVAFVPSIASAINSNAGNVALAGIGKFMEAGAKLFGSKEIFAVALLTAAIGMFVGAYVAKTKLIDPAIVKAQEEKTEMFVKSTVEAVNKEGLKM